MGSTHAARRAGDQAAAAVMTSRTAAACTIVTGSVGARPWTRLRESLVLVAVGAALVAATAGRPATDSTPLVGRQERGARARAAVMKIGRRLGFEPIDRELEKLGYDSESRVPSSDRLRFIGFKGRDARAGTVTDPRYR